jgi:antitoxin component of MazEF toxin-antitoxin module
VVVHLSDVMLSDSRSKKLGASVRVDVPKALNPALEMSPGKELSICPALLAQTLDVQGGESLRVVTARL